MYARLHTFKNVRVHEGEVGHFSLTAAAITAKGVPFQAHRSGRVYLLGDLISAFKIGEREVNAGWNEIAKSPTPSWVNEDPISTATAPSGMRTSKRGSASTMTARERATYLAREAATLPTASERLTQRIDQAVEQAIGANRITATRQARQESARREQLLRELAAGRKTVNNARRR